MIPSERHLLACELDAARSELAAAKLARAAQATADCYSAEESKLEDYASEIRRLSHSTATLQAQCDMSSAHLKALSAMANSTASQVRSRQTLLQSLLRQTEDLGSSQGGKRDPPPELELGGKAEEDQEERALNERLHALSLSCSKLKEVVVQKPLSSFELPSFESPHVSSFAESFAMLSEKAERLSSEISHLHEASAVLEEMPERPTSAWLELSKLRLRIPGSSLASLEALVSQVQELARVEEDLRRCSREKRLQHLRHEVVERQRHFNRMTHDLQAQVLRLEEEVARGRRRSSSVGELCATAPRPRDLKELELLRQQELRHLRDQEEQLEQMERQDLSHPPGPLVDPGGGRVVPSRSDAALSAHRSLPDGKAPDIPDIDIRQTSFEMQPPELGHGGSAAAPGAPAAPGHGRFALPEVYRRHTDFEERVSELKAVIGTSLQSLAEEGWLSSDSGVHN